MMGRPAFGRSVTGGHQRTPDQPGLAAFGRHGDTMLAHVNPEEAALLKARGGSGTRNPHTGLPEFFVGSSEMSSRESGFGGRSPGSGFRSKGQPTHGPGRAAGFGGSPEIGGARVDTVGGYGQSPGLAGFGGGAGASTKGFNILGRISGFGLGARPALDPNTRMPTAQATFNPISVATMGLVSPGFADIGLGHGYERAGTLNAPGSKTSAEDRKSMGRALVNSVLGKEDESAPAAAPPPTQRTFTPFSGDYLTYGQPGGATEHAFFRG